MQVFGGRTACYSLSCMRVSTASIFAVCVALAACSETTQPSSATSTTTQPEATAQPASRRLETDTTFAQLVGRARSLEASGDAETRARCVLGRREGVLHLDASVAPAIRPLPEAFDGLAERLMQGAEVSVLSRWGRRGDGPLALATITASAPLAESVVVLFVTPRGIYFRSAGGALPERARGNWALGRVRDGLASLALAPGATVVVTADGSLLVSVVADVLEAITPLGLSAVLAVALPEGTPIPAEPEPAARTAHETCEELPALRDDAVTGEVATTDLRRGAAQLSDVALACARSTSSLAVARGGRVDVLMRIGPDGGVVDACARADEIGDDAYRACLIGAARNLTFTRPIPPGYVDVSVPVRLRADATDALAPFCE